MRLQKLFSALLTFLILLVTACSYGVESEEQKIVVQIRIGNESKYKDFREINDKKQVLAVNELLKATEWEQRNANMSRMADYNFNFQFKNPNIKAKPVIHKIWISPNNDQLEITSGESEYAQLSREKSAILLKILIGDELVKKVE